MRQQKPWGRKKPLQGFIRKGKEEERTEVAGNEEKAEVAGNICVEIPSTRL